MRQTKEYTHKSQQEIKMTLFFYLSSINSQIFFNQKSLFWLSWCQNKVILTFSWLGVSREVDGICRHFDIKITSLMSFNIKQMRNNVSLLAES